MTVPVPDGTTPRPTFEQLLADPAEQFDKDGVLLRAIFDMNRAGLTEVRLQLCDDDGVVRRGALHDRTDYQCTGHAHYAGYHITCTNPVHVSEDAVYERWYQRWDGGE
jgi:hypothetical protein